MTCDEFRQNLNLLNKFVEIDGKTGELNNFNTVYALFYKTCGKNRLFKTNHYPELYKSV